LIPAIAYFEARLPVAEIKRCQTRYSPTI